MVDGRVFGDVAAIFRFITMLGHSLLILMRFSFDSDPEVI